MIDEVLIEETVSVILDVEMNCKKFLLLKGHCIDVVSDYYYSDEDFATISFSRNNDKLTIRFDNQQCIVTVENEIFTVTSEIIEEGIEIQIEILIKQLILGSWKKFIEDVYNGTFSEAIEKHGFDDYSDGPDAVVNY